MPLPSVEGTAREDQYLVRSMFAAHTTDTAEYVSSSVTSLAVR
jgi:hypothetical protein